MILTGIARLGGDVEVRYLQDGTPVANLSLAYNFGKKDSEGKRPTQWVSASLWGDRADALKPYLLKGTLLSVVVDDVHIETFDKRDGGQGFNLKGRVNSLEFAGGKKDGDKPAQEQARQPASSGGRTGGVDQMDDDIPW